MRRVFIGVPIRQGQQRQISAILDKVSNPGREIRWVAEQNRHLTLAFLGDQPQAVVETLARSMDTAYQQAPAFKSVFSALTRFPSSKGAIVALVCAGDATLDGLFRITGRLLEQHGLAAEHERFRPHITVGRIARPRFLKTGLDQPTNVHLPVDKVTFYQSTLTPTGSVYLVLKETRLAQAGARSV